MHGQSMLKTLIIEPNNELVIPYSYLDTSFNVLRVNSQNQILSPLSAHDFQLIFISCSLAFAEQARILKRISGESAPLFIPIIFVVDLSEPRSQVRGVTWAGKVGVLDSFASETQFTSVLERIYSLVWRPHSRHSQP